MSDDFSPAGIPIQQVTTTFQHLMEWLVDFVHMLGYPGVFIMTFLESTFVPIPSEVTMVPVGYLAYQGHMSLPVVLFLSISGTICGSLFNYYIAYHYGRRFLQAYGKYFLFGPDKMEKLDRFFATHGEISIFTGRLIPGVRHVISFPAGLARMDLRKFCIYTGAGGAIWMSVLIGIGYFIGGNKEMIKHYMRVITLGIIALLALMVIVYVINHRRKNGRNKEKSDGMAG